MDLPVDEEGPVPVILRSREQNGFTLQLALGNLLRFPGVDAVIAVTDRAARLDGMDKTERVEGPAWRIREGVPPPDRLTQDYPMIRNGIPESEALLIWTPSNEGNSEYIILTNLADINTTNLIRASDAEKEFVRLFTSIKNCLDIVTDNDLECVAFPLLGGEPMRFHYNDHYNVYTRLIYEIWRYFLPEINSRDADKTFAGAIHRYHTNNVTIVIENYDVEVPIDQVIEDVISAWDGFFREPYLTANTAVAKAAGPATSIPEPNEPPPLYKSQASSVDESLPSYKSQPSPKKQTISKAQASNRDPGRPKNLDISKVPAYSTRSKDKATHSQVQKDPPSWQKCIRRTKGGVQCRIKAMDGSKLCHIHG